MTLHFGFYQVALLIWTSLVIIGGLFSYFEKGSTLLDLIIGIICMSTPLLCAIYGGFFG